MRHGLAPLLALMVALSSASTARADVDKRGDAGWRKAAWGGLVGTAGMLIGVVVATDRVHDREDQRKFELEAIRTADPTNPILGMANACEAAEADPVASTSDLRATCASGRRWATVSNLFLFGTAVAGAFTGYAVYRGYFKRSERKSKVTVLPRVSTAGVGVSLSLGF